MASSRIFGFISFLSLFLFALAAPSTNKKDDVVQFTIDLTWGDFNPTGGVARKAIFTNGTIPGPALKLHVGQSVEFTVINNLPSNTSVHFHGIQQTGTPYSDGVPGVTQWPIVPGASFLYTWVADEAGTYFYHAHDKGQMMDGLYGAIIILPAEDAPKPFSLISQDPAEVAKMAAAEIKNEPVFISDWTQFTFEEFFQIQQTANIDNACTDSIIINGKGSVYCLARSDITAFTSPLVAPLLAASNPPQLTDKACLPPDLAPVQGPYQLNTAALPAAAYQKCLPSTGETATVVVDKADGWAVLTFINSGGFSTLKFTIDSHKVWVYAVNGHYVTPQLVDTVVVANGARYSCLIKLDQDVGTYQIRVANAGLNQLISGFAALEYKGSKGPAPNAVSVMNYAGINTTAIVPFVDAKAAPYPPFAPAATADATYSFEIKKLGHPWEWTITGKSAYAMSNDDVEPLLFRDINSIPDSDLIIKTKSNQWVDLIIKVKGPLAEPHPIHKHANKVFLLGAGVGDFNFTTVAEAAAVMPARTFNFANPPVGDGFVTPPATGNSSWMVLRYEVNNPGAWMLHCHMQTHFSGGMAAVLIDAVDKFPTVPQAYKNGNNGYASPLTGGKGSGSSSSSVGTATNATSSGASTATSATAKSTGASIATSATAKSTGASTTTPATANYTGASITTPAIAKYTGAASSISASGMTSTLLMGSAFLVALFSL